MDVRSVAALRGRVHFAYRVFTEGFRELFTRDVHERIVRRWLRMREARTGKMAQGLVANVATVANVRRSDAAARVLAKLPEYVSSAAGELGLLSLRPSENPNARQQASAKARRREKQHARRDRAIGGGVKGDILRAIYVRLATWMVKTGNTSRVAVVATDDEIATLLPLLVGTARANRVGRSERERRRALSQMAYDWKVVIGTGATRRAEDSDVDVTFYLGGGEGERLFWLCIELRAEGDVTRIVEVPVHGAAPPTPLTAVVDETKVHAARYMQWAELIHAAAASGDALAIAAASLIKGAAYAGAAAAKGAKGVGYVLAAVSFASLVFFALPVRNAHAEAVETVRAAVQRLRGYLVRNETHDNSLPQRLEVPGAPSYSTESYDYYQLSPTELVINHKHATSVVQEFLARHTHDATHSDHIEWEWAIQARYMTTRVFKHTENPQLRVVFDRPVAPTDLFVGCFPIHVVHLEFDKVTAPGLPQPPPGPPTQEERDEGDRLVIADPTTHDRPSPESPNLLERQPFERPPSTQ